MKVLCALIVLVCLCNYSFSQDACTFTSSTTPITMAEMISCFELIPFNETVRTNTLTELRKLIQLYSYTDISTDSGNPFNIQVDLAARMDTIEQNVYTYDYEFHFDLSRLFNELGDAHTLYLPPTPYRSFTALFPYIFQVDLVDNALEVTIREPVLSLTSLSYSQYATNLGLTLPANYSASGAGAQLFAVDGMNVIDWIQSVADLAGTARDPSVRFQLALKGVLPLVRFGITYNSFVEEIEFVTSAGTFTLPIIITGTPVLADASEFMSEIGLTSQVVKKEIKEVKYPEYFPQFDRHWTPPHYQEMMEINKKIQHDSKKKYEESIVHDDVNRQTISQATLVDQLPDFSWACFSYENDIMVFRISTFSPYSIQSDLDLRFTEVFRWWDSCISTAISEGLTRTIIDLHGNGGGFVCLNQALASALVPRWDVDFADFQAEDKLEMWQERNELYDISLNSVITDISVLGEGNNPLTGISKDDPFSPVDSDFFDTSVQFTRGGVTGEYSNKNLIGCNGVFAFSQQSSSAIRDFEFDRILLLSDGECGSACSQFSTKMRYHGKALVATWGGRLNAEHSFSIFCGGNVLDWDAFVDSSDPTNQVVDYLPTSAFTRFNYREMYVGQEDLPVEFQRYTGDFTFDSWESYSYFSSLDLTELNRLLDLTAGALDDPDWDSKLQALGNYYFGPEADSDSSSVQQESASSKLSSFYTN